MRDHLKAGAVFAGLLAVIALAVAYPLTTWLVLMALAVMLFGVVLYLAILDGVRG